MAKALVADVNGSAHREYRAAGDIRAEQPGCDSRLRNALEEILHEVPALLVPLHAGRPEGVDAFGYQASMWGSIIRQQCGGLCASGYATRGLGERLGQPCTCRLREAAEVLGVDYGEWGTESDCSPWPARSELTSKSSP